ncbi:MAG TPA: Gfo/Idh/MocA family oxidoreductase [Thermoanaerobaculia bacterium]|nr:Gfo/Idh/MocA family oxidoreductase [Thermoanaerobaculia bacterium]
MRIAVLGMGSIGRRHARNLRDLGQKDLVLFEPASDARSSLDVFPGSRVCARLEEVWDSRPNVVFVTAPTDQHAGLALEAARRGCHLFIEKPVSDTDEGLEVLGDEVESRRLISMVGCNMRFHPGPAKVRELIERGAIGEVIAARIHTGSYLPDWRPGSDYRASYSASASRGGGVILDCIHEIDLALWYFGPGAVLAAATRPAASIGLEVEGVAEILVLHDTGVLSSTHLNFVQRDYRRGCTIVGALGTLSWLFGVPEVLCARGGGEAPERHALIDGWEINDMYVAELRSFLECVAEGRPTPNPVAQARATLRVALEAKRLARDSAERLEAEGSRSRRASGLRAR